MPDLRLIVVRELRRRGWSNYRLVQELKGKRPAGRDVPSMTMYQFLRGQHSINSLDLGLIFDVLGLEVRGRTKKREVKP
jgi:hypothetical protein